ncbi:MAG: substrate-binding domain-containing protein [Christensenellaceae bacterium]|nr:substrate-binding domain-containing protein [Christensenellaceae bacterium]
MKRLFCILMVLILAATICGCEKKDTKKNDEKPLIGISMFSLMVERSYKDQEAFLAELSRLGADVIVQNANNDAQLQADQIDELIDKGIDVLIVTPIISSVIADRIERAKQQGIAVIAYERLVENTKIDAYYSFDNVRVGELLAIGLIDGMGSGNIMIINGDRNDHNTTLYRTGYMKILEPYISDGSIRIVTEAYCYNWETEHAYSALEDALSAGLKIDGILATNDALAGAAIQVLSEKGIAGKTIVVGQDGDLAAYQQIVEGTQHATVYKPFTKLASAAALAAYRLSRGTPVAYTDTINNGVQEVKYYKLEPKIVTAENIDDAVIKSGVYTKDEVYMNVVG